MTKTGRIKALAVAAAVALALYGLAWVGAQPAGAAFPGTNGKIVYSRAFDSWTKNASLASQETKLLDDADDVAYSPDGSRVVFERANEIYVTNAAGTGKPRRLTNDCLLDSAPVWSHDGTRIAFVRRSSSSDPTSCSGQYNIWTMNADGTNQRQMTSEGGYFSPSWSVPVLPGAPDGRILYKGGGLDIWTMNPDGSGKVKLTYTCPTENGICDDAVGNPTFSPDGTEIAAEYFGDIFVIPAGGGESRVILGTKQDGYPGQERDPAWSPDGKQIAFEHNGNVGGSASGIYVANADGSSAQAVQVTAKTGEVNPDWQPLVPSLRIGDARVKEKTTSARFTVGLSVASDQSVTVSYATADGTAKAPADYAAKTGTLTFAPGETSKTVSVAVKSDRKNEPNETFFVNLSDANTTVADAIGKGTIIDND